MSFIDKKASQSRRNETKQISHTCEDTRGMDKMPSRTDDAPDEKKAKITIPHFYQPPTSSFKTFFGRWRRRKKTVSRHEPIIHHQWSIYYLLEIAYLHVKTRDHFLPSSHIVKVTNCFIKCLYTNYYVPAIAVCRSRYKRRARIVTKSHRLSFEWIARKEKLDSQRVVWEILLRTRVSSRIDIAQKQF